MFSDHLHWSGLWVQYSVLLCNGCESWTVKKAERWRIGAFELWCWRRLLRVLWTARISNQSILKEISPEYPLKWLILKLKLQYLMEEPTYWKRPSCWKDWRQEEKGTTEDEMVGWHHQFKGHEYEQDLGVGNGLGILACCSSRGCKELDMTEQLNATELNWTEPAMW